jgi:translation machinery-associated protein 16
LKATQLTQVVDRIDYIHEAIQELTEALTTEEISEFVAKYVN